MFKTLSLSCSRRHKLLKSPEQSPPCPQTRPQQQDPLLFFILRLSPHHIPKSPLNWVHPDPLCPPPPPQPSSLRLTATGRRAAPNTSSTPQPPQTSRQTLRLFTNCLWTSTERNTNRSRVHRRFTLPALHRRETENRRRVISEATMEEETTL